MIDQRVKYGIKSINDRLKAVKLSQCNNCTILEERVERKDRESIEKEKEILHLNLKLDKVKSFNPHYTGPHSARKSELLAKRETLNRNVEIINSARRAPIQ
jgi:hypothetical protein